MGQLRMCRRNVTTPAQSNLSLMPFSPFAVFGSHTFLPAREERENGVDGADPERLREDGTAPSNFPRPRH
jgi:hypothetical protein